MVKLRHGVGAPRGGDGKRGLGILMGLALWAWPVGVMAAHSVTGSASCRECHVEFHDRWESSRHGASVRAVDVGWVGGDLGDLPAEVRVEEALHRLVVRGDRLVVDAADPGGGRREVPVEFGLGGRDVWYLLGALEDGRLQTLPVAFDIRRREWFNPGASAVRPHAVGREEAVEWTSPAYTFNASCYGCHVSGGRRPEWAGAGGGRWWDEPGIRCESCHGPGEEHIRVCREAGAGVRPEDLRIVAAGSFSGMQLDGLCGSCHARQRPITSEFRLGDGFFDHFDLLLLEDEDFWADGRERGETYTMTTWQANRCAQEGGLTCMHCHTSSGRDRYPGERANLACMPCHADKLEAGELHTRHAVGKAGSRCVDCHMPVTEFARMRRHDHSFRAPVPWATMELGSPNACQACHGDRGPEWADVEVRRWHERDYQEPVVRRARWIERARRSDWSDLEGMLASLERESGEVLYVASLIRLLGACDDERKVPALVAGLRHRSPLVQASAAGGLAGYLSGMTLPGLVEAAGHPVRLVRVRAAQALAPVPDGLLTVEARERVDRAFDEFEAAMQVETGDGLAWETLGHFRLDRGDVEGARAALMEALRLDPGNLGLLISAATAARRAGREGEAEALLKRAVESHPRSELAWFSRVVQLELSGRGAEAVRVRDEARKRLSEAGRADFDRRWRTWEGGRGPGVGR
jgi:hypothetical protein